MLDQNASKDNLQDCWAVIYVLDAVIAFLRLELSTVTTLSLVTNNAGNYQNDLLQVIAPFLTFYRVVQLEGLIHLESSRGE